MMSRFFLMSLTCVGAWLISLNLQAQNEDVDSGGGEGHHHRNELSVATGLVPLIAEDELSWGIHIHYIRGIGDENKVGIGIGLETIVDEHRHYTISGVLHYRIYKGLIFSLAPGLLILKEEDKYLLQFAQHFELAYELEIGEFHLGPVAELGLETIGVHYMVGLHFGIDF
jgi:hypothetical protein